MAKESGLGANLYIDGWDISGDTNSVGTLSKALAPLPVTGIDKYAVERLPGKLTGRIAWVSYWNPTNAHLALETLPRTSRVVTYLHRPLLGSPAASMVAQQISYDPKREDNGGLTATVDTLSNAWWLDWGLSLTNGKRTDTTATNGDGVDFGDPTPIAYSFGLQAHLHVFAFTGTNVTITLEQSSDNGVGDTFAPVTGGTFALVTTAHTSERIATARNQSVERYLRVVTSGTFSSVTFAVNATINRTDMTI
jgi:hypothetical protein